MNSNIDVEDALQRLGRDWPAGDSIVKGVMQGLDSMPPRPANYPARGRGLRRTVLVAASVAVCAGLWWASSSSKSVYAQAREAIRRARTFQMTSRFIVEEGDKGQPSLTMAYERGVGFHEERPGDISIGNLSGSWHYRKDARLAVKTKGIDISRMVDRFLDHELEKAFAGATHERDASRDQSVDGRPCQAYVITRMGHKMFADFDADRQQLIVLKDNQSRIVQMIAEVRPMNKWIVRGISELKYDVPLDPTLFQPQFPDDVRVVDADSAFEHFVDLEHAVYRTERSGLSYAIHHAERIENGGLFFVTSARGTEATLKKYPLKERPLGPGKTFIDGPASQYRPGMDGGVPGLFIELASADHQGINVSWWVLLPMAQMPQSPFDTGKKTVSVPVVISPSFSQFWKDNFTDEKGITHGLTWIIAVDVPTPETFRSLDSITRNVYADLTALEGVPFKFPNMGNRGCKPARWYDLDKITPDQFAEAVAEDLRWWEKGAPQDDPRVQELMGKAPPSK